MATDDKIKSENYSNFGGMNQKVSRYVTGPNEFLNLQNVDLKTPGSLSSFWGSTGIFGILNATPITGVADWRNFSKVATDYNSLLLYGYNASLFVGGVTTLYSFIPTFIGASAGSPTLTINANFKPMDFTAADFLFMANGREFIAWGGTSSVYQYSLPFPRPRTGNQFSPSGSGGGLGGSGGTLSLFFAFVRSDGFLGPANRTDYSASGATTAVFSVLGFTSALGLSRGSFGISGTAMWYSVDGNFPKMFAGTSSYLVNGVPAIDTAVFTSFSIGDAFTGWTNNGTDAEDFYGTFVEPIDTSTTLPYSSYLANNNPVVTEEYNNQLFLGGSVENPDTVYFSEIGEYEKVPFEYSFDVGKGDGDIVSSIKNYFTQLVIFKTRSIYALSGDDPENFVVVKTNSEYGCLSSRSCCVFENRLWFLDKEGIAEYNGANTKIISQKVEPIFRRMNVEAARRVSSMIHVKTRNEIWCAIPVDGKGYPNMVVIYDYLANAWYTKTFGDVIGLAIDSSLTALSPFTFGGSLSSGITKTIVNFGTPLSVGYFSESLSKDYDGNSMFIKIQGRFVGDLGHSVEKMFRRLYIDCDVPSGATYPMLVNFYTNQGQSTPALSVTFTMTEFQKRIDFGLSAKDLSPEFVYSGGLFLKLNGYTIEYRFQRAV